MYTKQNFSIAKASMVVISLWKEAFFNPNGNQRNLHCWFLITKAVLGMLSSLISTCQYLLFRSSVLKMVAPCKASRISCIWAWQIRPVVLSNSTRGNLCRTRFLHPFFWPTRQVRPMETLIVALCLALTSLAWLTVHKLSYLGILTLQASHHRLPHFV